jgi:ABC-2 type transport system ATP-binding protein
MAAAIQLGVPEKTLVDLFGLKLSISGREILHEVRLHMEQADIYGLLGPNGAGKSTTMSVITGLRPASAGRAMVLGRDPWLQRKEIHQSIGVLPEQMGLYGWMNAHEYLAWFGLLFERRLSEAELAQSLERVGLDPTNRRPTGTYSRGMKQRLGLARALVNQPQLLILDEPTTGLDPRGRREMHDVLVGLRQQQGVGVLLSTHLLDDVERLCTRIGIIYQGRTVVEGRPAELLATRATGQRYRLRLISPPEPTAVPAGVKLSGHQGDWWQVELASGVDPTAMWRALLERGWRISEVHSEDSGLESLYLAVTAGQENQ